MYISPNNRMITSFQAENFHFHNVKNFEIYYSQQLFFHVSNLFIVQ